MIRWLLLAAILLVCVPARAQTANDAVTMAAADLASLPEAIRPHQRYLWNHDARPHWFESMTFALNCISRTEITIVPTRVRFEGYPHLDNMLARVDLLALAPGKDYLTMRALWDSLVIGEPYFYALGNGSTEIVPVTVCGREIGALNTRVFGPHIRDRAAADALAAQTGLVGVDGVLIPSFTPILRGDHFLSAVLTTVNGGRYYDFLGIQGMTQDEYLLSRGASEAQVAARNSDERAVVVRSKNTGKMRRIDVFHHHGTKPTVGYPIVTITHDIFDEDVKSADSDPIRNLSEFVDRGRECILTRANGWHEWTLFNAAGKLVDKAPPNLAADHLIPDPHTKELYAAMGCIRCHGPERGFQPFTNDVHRLLGRVNVFGDLRAVDQSEQLRRLAGLYTGDLRLPLMLARNSYAGTVWKATRMPVAELSAVVADIHDSYRYRIVDPLLACQELGITPIMGYADLAAFTLSIALTPPTADASGVALEDPNVALLQSGIGLNRDQFAQIYTDLAVRAAPWIARNHQTESDQ